MFSAGTSPVTVRIFFIVTSSLSRFGLMSVRLRVADEHVAKQRKALLSVVEVLGHRSGCGLGIAAHDGLVDLGVLDSGGIAPMGRLRQRQRMLLEDRAHILDQ